MRDRVDVINLEGGESSGEDQAETSNPLAREASARMDARPPPTLKLAGTVKSPRRQQGSLENVSD